jgi:hypothetical protein
MTDEQFNSLMIHIRALIILVGLLVGVLLGFGWELIR